MNLSEYISHDSLSLAQLVRSREVSASELMDLAVQAADRVNPRINAIVETWPGEPHGAPGDGPFAGVPFLIKDAVLHMQGQRCEMGSRLAAGLIAPGDSHLMARFRKAGLITFGRTAAPEMAYCCTTESALHGLTRNPWNPAHGAGGSSGGAAAAVAAGIVPMAHANDGGGSTRIPAASCGLFGLKPSRGRVPIGPDADEGLNGLGAELAVSRTVRDSAALLDCVHGAEAGDPFVIAPPARPYAAEVNTAPGALRIGLTVHAFGGARTAPVVAAAVETVARQCTALGHHVEIAEIDMGVAWEDFLMANARIWTSNLAGWIDALAGATGRPVDESTLEHSTLACYAFGRALRATELLAAFDIRNRVTRNLGAWFATNDVLMSPTLPDLPAPIGWFSERSANLDGFGWTELLFNYTPFTPVFNVTGSPAMSMPLAHDDTSGLPIGVQFAAGFGREDILFRLAGQLERAMPWTQRRPTIHAA
ncbi:MAG: amidase [Sphingobium sp.]|nr:MAG: amidase [Sphingobium sp.]